MAINRVTREITCTGITVFHPLSPSYVNSMTKRGLAFGDQPSARLCARIRGVARLVSRGEPMAHQHTPRTPQENTYAKLETRHLTKEPPSDDFAPLAGLAVRPVAGDAFKPDNCPRRRAHSVLLDSNKSRGYKLNVIMQWVRVALALVVIFAVAYVLITPDSSDDVYGVLRPRPPAIGLLAVLLWEPQIAVTVQFHSFTLAGSLTRHLASDKLLEIISVYRC